MADCCVINVPGPTGPAGTDGTDGTNGSSAYTTLTAALTMPAELASVTAAVADSTCFTVGQTVYIYALGYLTINAIGSTTQMTLVNPENTATGVYASNAAPGTVAAIGSKVSAAGIQGPTGSAAVAGAGTTESYLLRTAALGALPNSQNIAGLAATGFMRYDLPTNLVQIQANPITIAQGGTNAITAPLARASLAAAPANATFITQTPNAELSAEQALSALATGYVQVTTATGVLTSQAVPIPVADGGTGAITAALARTSLASAPNDATYITQTANGELSAEQALSTLATGYMIVTTGTGAITSQAVPIPVADGGSGSTTAAGARTNFGLGTISTQDANAVAITGGSVSGITDLAVADGGTGASNAAGARTNLGAAALGANTDITSLGGLTTPLSKAQGGTGAIAMPAFRAHRNGVTQSIAGSSAITQVQFNSEVAPGFDTTASYDTGAYAWTPTVAGYYRLTACVRFDALTAADAISIYIYKDGAAIAHYHKHSTDTDDSIMVTVCAISDGTNAFDCRVAQANVAAKNITGVTSECWFEGNWIA